jgi:hypothetical protein
MKDKLSKRFKMTPYCEEGIRPSSYYELYVAHLQEEIYCKLNQITSLNI